MKLIKQETIKKSVLALGQFNGGEHTYLECEEGKHQTLSVKLPNGKFVTFAFIPSGDAGEIECVDIHSTVGQPFKYKSNDADTDVHYQQNGIGFGRNFDSFDTRKSVKAGKPTGLMTLLLHSNHNL